jgi:hypothetical protein
MATPTPSAAAASKTGKSASNNDFHDSISVWIGVFLFVLFPVLAGVLFWLVGLKYPDAAQRTADTVRKAAVMSEDQRLMLAVMVTGAMGSYVHVATSFSDFMGSRHFRASWAWWYGLRPAIGTGLAVIFYFLLRGGILTITGTSGDVTPELYPVLAIAGLAGMFSKQATDKLSDVFDTLFKSDKEAQRKDKMENPAPTLTALTPAEVVGGGAAITVTAKGTGFVGDSVARVDGADRPTTFKTADSLTFELTAADLAAAGGHQVTVFNPAPGGGLSAAMKLSVSAAAPTPPPPAGTIPTPKIVGGNGTVAQPGTSTDAAADGAADPAAGANARASAVS